MSKLLANMVVGFVLHATAAAADPMFVASGSLVIDLDVTGHLPAQAWSMDAVICVEGSATYSR